MEGKNERIIRTSMQRETADKSREMHFEKMISMLNKVHLFYGALRRGTYASSPVTSTLWGVMI